MRLLLLLWAMLASLGVALSGTAAARSPVAASVTVGEQMAAPAPIQLARPANRPAAAAPLSVHVAPARSVPLFADRRRE